MYLKIGVVCFCSYELPELKRLVDAALRKEGLPWGSSTVVVRRSDPNIETLEHQFRQSYFAGMAWRETLQAVIQESEYLLVVGDSRKYRDIKNKLKSYPNVRKTKFIDT